MTLPITSVVKQTDSSWLCSWTSTGAAFYRVILYGQQVAITTTNSYAFTGNGYAAYPPPLEVTDSVSPTPSESYKPYIVMQWYGQTTVVLYNVEKFAGTWSGAGQLAEIGLWLYTFQTPALTDETSYRYRVSAIDSIGNVSPTEEYDHFVVTPPLPPNATIVVSYTGPSAHQVQVAAA